MGTDVLRWLVNVETCYNAKYCGRNLYIYHSFNEYIDFLDESNVAFIC